MIIHVTQEDIDLANEKYREHIQFLEEHHSPSDYESYKYRVATQCPVARAIKRELGYPDYRISVHRICYNINDIYYPFDERVISFIRQWDNEQSMVPFDFEIAGPTK